MASAALWPYSAERLFKISRLSRSAERSKRIFTGGVVDGNGRCSACFLRKQSRCEGESEDACGEYPFSLATLASSPKGAPFGATAKFSATAETVPLGKVAKPQALTEGVSHGSKLPQSPSATAPSRMGPLAWRESSRLNCKVSGFARGSLPEGAGKTVRF